MSISSALSSSQPQPQTKTLMAHEAEIIIPGSFVVQQGNAGDGLSNTMDTLPVLMLEDVHDDVDDLEDTTTTTRVDMQQDDDDDDDDDEDSEEFHHVENVVMQEEQDTTTGAATLATATATATATLATATATLATAMTPPPITLGQLALANRHSAAAAVTLNNRFSTSIVPPPPPTATTTAAASDDPYIVVTDDQESSSPLPIPTISQQQQQQQQRPKPSTTSSNININNNNNNTAIATWQVDCRNREVRQRKEWRQDHQQLLKPAAIADNGGEEKMWWQCQGRIALFRDVPTKLKGSGAILKSVLGTLAPGSTIVATDIVYLDSTTLQRIVVPPITTTTTTSTTTSTSSTTTTPHQIYPRGKKGWIQMIKLEAKEGRSVYALLSLDGYPFLTPGLPSLYVDPHVWVWRVMCPAGAFVREGLDLYTPHLETLPLGSLVRVTRRTVNNMGLSRLRVTAIVDDHDDDDNNNIGTSTSIGTSIGTRIGIGTTTTSTKTKPRKRVIDGWCSEFLNPLSGQRGMVAQPLAFPVPALYRVTLPVGAVIRSDVELSSRQIGQAPEGAILVIAGRAFSEHPMDKCIERLRLAGHGGWISVRLNRPPPQDDLVVELVGIDGTFDPDSPGIFHLEATKKVQASEMEPTTTTTEGSGRDERRTSSFGVDLSSIDSSTTSSSGSHVGAAAKTVARRRAPNAAAAARHGGPNAHETCLICLNEARNATIVHGETGHVACCLTCARILKARGDKCPVCRLTIDSVIQQFWA